MEAVSSLPPPPPPHLQQPAEEATRSSRKFHPEPVETTVRSRHKMKGSPEETEGAGNHLNTASSSARAEISHQDSEAKPTRRFAPEPVETSTRSSRKFAPEPVETTTRSSRKFAPEPVETTTRSSRKFAPEPEETTTRSSRKLAPEPEETTTRSSRKFAPEPVETSSRSSRKFAPEPVETTTRSSKKFAPEPVETTKRSRRGGPHAEESSESTEQPTKKRFSPEPVETTTIRHGGRRRVEQDEDEDETQSDETEDSQLNPSRSSSLRKFSPELLETARGSFKRATPAHPPPTVSAHLRPPTRENHSESDPNESRFSAAALAKRHPPERQHSYMAPDLPCIDSDSSEEDSDLPSLSESPTASSEDTLEPGLRRPSRGRQGGDNIFQARSTSPLPDEKVLREQAMAAYINEKEHEPVAHFAIDHDEEEEGEVLVHVGKLSGDNGIDPRTFRRDSAIDLDWELKQMRKHHLELEELKRNTIDVSALGVSQFSAAALASRAARGVKKALGRKDPEEVELAKMRDAASPPMLGDDLVFPLSVSPKMTRLTPDQVPVPRKAKEKQEATEESCAGPKLWLPCTSSPNSTPGGLWMGMCHQDPEEDAGSRAPTPPNRARSGIMTPALDADYSHPHDRATPGKPHGRFGHGMGFLPLTPPRYAQDEFTESLDRKLRREETFELEFSPSVITQIYNYLSLGYPSLAHKFDPELSKISRIPLEELRRDDDLADAKGYVGAPEGDGVDEDVVISGGCARWLALRLYVREWCRQLPEMALDKEREDWGVRGRRGSWAI